MYDPHNPDNAHLQSSVTNPVAYVVMSLVGLIPLLIGFLIMISPLLRRRQDDWLNNHGTTIAVPVLRIDNAPSSNSFTIIAQWQNPQDQQVYVFESDPLGYDPSSYIKDNPVSILIDPNNPKSYKMDLSFLPKEG